MASLVIGGATLSLGYGKVDRNGRDVYEVYIDLPDGTEHEITDLRSGCQGGGIQEGFSALLSFLSASAESRRYREGQGKTELGENEDLFSPAIVDWASENSDELSMLACEIEETKDLIVE